MPRQVFAVLVTLLLSIRGGTFLVFSNIKKKKIGLLGCEGTNNIAVFVGRFFDRNGCCDDG